LTQEVAKSHMLAPHQDGVKEKPRAATRHPESAIHAAADEHLAQLSVAARYAFAMGRKALGKNPANAAKAAAAVKAALLDVLPSALLKPLAAGGQVALDELPRLKAAGGQGSGNFGHGGRPGEVGGSSAVGGRGEAADTAERIARGDAMFHGTTKAVVDKILKEGLNPDSQDRVFLTHNLDKAQYYASTNTDDLVQGVVLEVKVPESEVHRLEEIKSARGLPSRLVIKGRVPPEWIHVHSKFEDGKWRTLVGGKTVYVGMLVDVATGELRTLGDVEGHEFHGNQWTEGHVEIAHFSGTRVYKLSDAAVKLRKDDAFLWAEDLLPSLDGKRPAGFSDSENARKAGAAKALNALAEKHGVNGGLALTIQDEGGRRVGLATIARERINDKDYPDFLKAIGSYMGGHGVSTTQEKVLGKWLAFPKQSTEAYLKNKVRSAAAGPLNMKFDVSNPAAVAWAKEHAGELAVGISDTTEQAIKDAVAQALESGDDPADAIEAAVGDADRADLIARTEVMTAANEGQRQAWDQATEAGLLTGDEQAVWIATEDACPECEALDGETRSLDGEYPDDGGDGPPLHPNCRCTEGLQ
jgi:hypothetical protein